MNKEAARLTVAQNVFVQPMQTKSYSLSGLLQTFSSGFKPSAQPPPSSEPEPIENFRSSPSPLGPSASAPRPQRSEGTRPPLRHTMTAPPYKQALAHQSSVSDVFLSDGSPSREERTFGQPVLLLAGPSSPSTKRSPNAGIDGSLESHQRGGDSDEEMPTLGGIFAEDKVGHAKAEKGDGLAQLRARKQQLVEIKARAQAQQAEPSSDDDDLEIVAGHMHTVIEEEAAHRRAVHASGKKPSEGRKRQLVLARTSPIKPNTRRKSAIGFGIPTQKQDRKGKGKTTAAMSKNDLNRQLLKEAEKRAEEERRAREDEWVRRGGTLKAPSAVSGAAEAEAWGAYAKRAKEVGERADFLNTGNENEVDEDEDDEDWNPDLGSGDELGVVPTGSRSLSQTPSGIEADQEDDAENIPAPTMPPPTATQEDDGPSRRSRIRRRPQAVESDTESEPESATGASRLPLGNVLVPGTSTILAEPPMVHRESVSSLGDGTDRDDNTDKENDTRLMFDFSEDKENTAVVRHSQSIAASPLHPISPLQRTVASPLSRRNLLSRTPSIFDDDEARPPSLSSAQRTPLKELESRDDDDLFASPAGLSRRNLLSELLSSTPKEKESESEEGIQLAPSPSLAPAPLGLKDQKNGSFSQFFATQNYESGDIPIENEEGQQRPAVLQAGFSQLFENGSMKPPPKVPSKPGLADLFSPTQVCLTAVHVLTVEAHVIFVFDSLRSPDSDNLSKHRICPYRCLREVSSLHLRSRRTSDVKQMIFLRRNRSLW
jgi:mediator of replication checkpoint protein 1